MTLLLVLLMSLAVGRAQQVLEFDQRAVNELSVTPFILGTGDNYRDLLTVEASRSVAKYAQTFHTYKEREIQRNKQRSEQEKPYIRLPVFQSSPQESYVPQIVDDNEIFDFLSSRFLNPPEENRQNHALPDDDVRTTVTDGAIIVSGNVRAVSPSALPEVGAGYSSSSSSSPGVFSVSQTYGNGITLGSSSLPVSSSLPARTASLSYKPLQVTTTFGLAPHQVPSHTYHHHQPEPAGYEYSSARYQETPIRPFVHHEAAGGGYVGGGPEYHEAGPGLQYHEPSNYHEVTYSEPAGGYHSAQPDAPFTAFSNTGVHGGGGFEVGYSDFGHSFDGGLSSVSTVPQALNSFSTHHVHDPLQEHLAVSVDHGPAQSYSRNTFG